MMTVFLACRWLYKINILSFLNFISKNDKKYFCHEIQDNKKNPPKAQCT